MSEVKIFNVPGKNKLVSGGLEHGALDQILAKGEADIIVTDPPWGPGLVKLFYRHNKGRADLISWGDFLTAFCSNCAAYCLDGPVYVFMGNKYVDDLAENMHGCGIDEKRRFDVFYQSSSGARPCTLWAGSRANSSWYGPLGIPESMPDTVAVGEGKNPPLDRVIKWALKQHPSISNVLDPCCGKGQTAKVALSMGLTFFGCELNHDRAEATARVIEKTYK